jgi:DegV family protein with EDD domain
MAHKIALITDSTCDVPQKWREEHDITVIPSIIIFGDEQYLDGIDLNAEQFYEKLSKEKHHPTTSHPSPIAFLEAYQKAAEKGAEQILVIVVAAAMSGTFIAAQQAAQNVDIPVHVIDSCSNSMGLGWQLIAAARVRENGGDLKEMIAAVEQVRSNMVYFVSLNTIEFLLKGGRIGDAIRLVESVLTIKPLVYVKRENGTVGVSLPARSRKLAIKGLQKEFFKKVNLGLPLHIAVLHNNVLDEAKQIAQNIKETYNPKELIISFASPILGVHTGPKALALCGYTDPLPDVKSG